ncbi:CoxG family protein [Halocatena halophila]|uniref:CoxG family protein n=1 Tax=Halocatena halophila TaxID=2814576 RepID=UPI002ED3F26C
MTVELSQTIEIAAAPEAVWRFIADPEKRAQAISVVQEYEAVGPQKAIWHVELPIPLVRQTIPITTTETDREPPEYVRFTGRSSAVTVIGEHELEPMPTGTTLTNTFSVTGKLPGVERFFRRNLDRELSNIEAALQKELNRC